MVSLKKPFWRQWRYERSMIVFSGIVCSEHKIACKKWNYTFVTANNDFLVTRDVICQWIFTRDFVTRENHWQITSLVTKKSLFTVTKALFSLSLYVYIYAYRKRERDHFNISSHLHVLQFKSFNAVLVAMTINAETWMNGPHSIHFASSGLRIYYLMVYDNTKQVTII